ncbi:MAG: TIM barrel protein [Sedimentisphaerales bacterium]|nr:TIM barrel protein [Sedimentisphaerales bacterium]
MQIENQQKSSRLTRRDVLGGLAAGAAGVMATGSVSSLANAEVKQGVKNGRIKQSVCQWCYGGVSFDDLAAHAAKIGLVGFDLAGPDQWPTLKKYGLICTMTPSHGIGKGLNRIENHEECLAKITKSIEATSEWGYRNVICFSGNREGMEDEEGLKNCVIGLKKIAGLAEKKKVIVCMELLNSKRNHKDYMCDRTHWGAEMCKQVGSPNVKLLYDIYHMQVQEGDVIATIKEYAAYIGHYHTAGVPGRNEFDDTQELYYPAICKAIIATGFDGYMGQEFIPRKKDKLASLTQAVEICDV